MATFIGTLIIVTLCCLALALGLLVAGKPLSGGCGKTLPGKLRCLVCPHRRRGECKDRSLEGESR